MASAHQHAHRHHVLGETHYPPKGHGARIPYSNYRLTGKTIRIRKKTPISDGQNKFGHPIYPWAYGEQKVFVIQETPYFITIEIPEHINPSGMLNSTPYATSIQKNDIVNGEFILEALDGERIR